MLRHRLSSAAALLIILLIAVCPLSNSCFHFIWIVFCWIDKYSSRPLQFRIEQLKRKSVCWAQVVNLLRENSIFPSEKFSAGGTAQPGAGEPAKLVKKAKSLTTNLTTDPKTDDTDKIQDNSLPNVFQVKNDKAENVTCLKVVPGTKICLEAETVQHEPSVKLQKSLPTSNGANNEINIFTSASQASMSSNNPITERVFDTSAVDGRLLKKITTKNFIQSLRPYLNAKLQGSVINVPLETKGTTASTTTSTTTTTTTTTTTNTTTTTTIRPTSTSRAAHRHYYEVDIPLATAKITADWKPRKVLRDKIDRKSRQITEAASKTGWWYMGWWTCNASCLRTNIETARFSLVTSYCN